MNSLVHIVDTEVREWTKKEQTICEVCCLLFLAGVTTGLWLVASKLDLILANGINLDLILR